ncbi:MAG TPA: asparagine synthase-related protein [Candidatus Methanoperedens sp.]|nr:asparagine synthase-related protein [Candidatus Methanoperedens sp.]
MSAQDVALLRKHVPDGEVFRLGLRPPSVMVRKPLMLGLPIYYCSTASSLIASTHIRLLAALGVKLKEEQSVLPEFFLYRYVMPPRTLFQDVFCLPLDGNVRAFVEGDSIAVGEPVWTNVFRKTTTRYGLEESATRIKEDLERTVDDLKPHGDAVGCLMSGGVDSSILYKLCKDRLSLRESHSTGYPFEAEEHNDERKYAETASAAFGSKHTYHSFRTQDFLHAVVDATYHAEIPVIAMQSALLELVFNRGLAEHLRTVLCGEGADSLFGLPIMYSYHKLRGVTRPALAPVLWLLAHTLKNRLYPWERMYAFSKRRWDLDFSNVKHGLWLTGEFADKRWVKDRYAVDEEALLKGRRAIIERFSLDNVFDAFTVLAYVSDAAIIQDIWGKLGDAQGRWICYPFNSPELIRVAHHTSWDDKMSVHKRLIRRAGQLVGVPDPILFRPKLTFGISARQWAAPGGVLEALFRVASPVVESDVLRRFLSPDEKRAMTGWTLVNYAIWKRMLIDGEPPERLHAELQGSP